MMGQRAHPILFADVGVIPLHRQDGSIRAWTVVDADDFDDLTSFNWHWADGYAARNVQAPSGRYQETMARRILGLGRGRHPQADHKDRNRLNNRRSNLRIVTHAQNLQNVPSKAGTSVHRGVSWREDLKKWRADATSDGRRYYAYFDDELEAAAAAASARQELMPFALD